MVIMCNYQWPVFQSTDPFLWSNLLIIPSGVDFISAIVFFSYVWLLFIVSNFAEILIVFIHSLSSMSTFRSLPSTLYWVDWLSPLRLVLFLRFCLISSSGVDFYVSLFCPVLYVFSYVHQLQFSILEKWLCVGNIQWGPEAFSHLVIRGRGPSVALIWDACTLL